MTKIIFSFDINRKQQIGVPSIADYEYTIKFTSFSP